MNKELIESYTYNFKFKNNTSSNKLSVKNASLP